MIERISLVALYALLAAGCPERATSDPELDKPSRSHAAKPKARDTLPPLEVHLARAGYLVKREGKLLASSPACKDGFNLAGLTKALCDAGGPVDVTSAGDFPFGWLMRAIEAIPMRRHTTGRAVTKAIKPVPARLAPCDAPPTKCADWKPSPFLALPQPSATKRAPLRVALTKGGLCVAGKHVAVLKKLRLEAHEDRANDGFALPTLQAALKKHRVKRTWDDKLARRSPRQPRVQFHVDGSLPVRWMHRLIWNAGLIGFTHTGFGDKPTACKRR